MRRAGLVLTLLFLLFGILLIFWISSQNFSQSFKSLQAPLADSEQYETEKESSDEANVALQRIEVIDGDTIDVDGVRVRYIGVNTPELARGGRASDCFATKAYEFNRTLVEKGGIRLEKDVSETDKYSRLLRYVYLPDNRMVNEILVEEGYARVATYPPDVANANRFKDLEKEARQAKRGLWGECI